MRLYQTQLDFFFSEKNKPKFGFKVFVFVVFIQSWIGTATATTVIAGPTADQYKQCGVLVYNAHSLFENPQDKMGSMVNATKLFEKWQKMLGFSNEEALEKVKPLIQKSFQEFDSKEKFHATYSDEDQKFCADLLKMEQETK